MKRFSLGDAVEVRSCIFSAKVHSKEITKDLREIRVIDAEKDERLGPADIGKYWCRNCRTRGQPTNTAAVPPVSSRSLRPLGGSGSTSADNFRNVNTCMFTSRHKKPITKELRPIKSTDLDKDPLLVEGKFWCSQCRKNSEKKFITAKSKGEDTGHEASFHTSQTLAKPTAEQVTQQKRPTEEENTESEPCKGTSSVDNTNFDLNFETNLTPDLVQETTNEAADTGEPQCIFYKLGSCVAECITVEQLDADELYALSWNSGKWKFNTASALCRVHQEEFIEKYKACHPTFLDSCCSPFGSHSKKIKKNLTKVTVSLVSFAKEKNLNVVYGNKICHNCYNEIFRSEPKVETPELSPEASSSSSLLSPAVVKAKALDALTKSGIKLSEEPRHLAGRVKYGKRKLEEATEEIQKKISRVLNIKRDQLLPDVYQKAQDMDSLMADIKAKLPTANRKEKYQLLTLVPLSIPLPQAQESLGVSRFLLTRAREIKEQHGILATPQFSRSSTILDVTKELVVQFYLEEENSKVLPGIRDCVSVSKNVYEQKRLLLFTLGELYALFLQKFPDLKIGRSIFFSLRPKWCVFPRSTGTHIVCVCQIHEDFKLVLNALKIKDHYRELISSLVCDTNSRSCMLRLCDQCPSNSDILVRIQKLVAESMEFTSDLEEDAFYEEEVIYHQWRSTDRSELVDLVCPRSELLNIVVRQLIHLIPHDYVAQKQGQYVREFKEDMPPTNMKILMDFAMNFSCTFHKETQSYHFNKTQVTLHPVVLYHKTNEEEEVKTESICFVSNDLNHDVALAKYPNILEVEYISDGSGSQYKNKFSFYNLCQHEREFGLKAKHSFFATSHGKALCDAMAGTIKRLLTNRSLQRPDNDALDSAEKVYELLKSDKLSEKINFVFIPKEESATERSVQLPKDQLVTIPGTRTFHCFVPLSETTVGCKRLSSDEQFALKHCLLKQSEAETQPAPTYEQGSYVVVKAVGRRHVAYLTDLNQDEQEAEVATLMPRIPSASGIYKWRENLEALIVPIPHIFCSLELQDFGNNSFKFTATDIAQLKKLGVLKKIAKWVKASVSGLAPVLKQSRVYLTISDPAPWPQWPGWLPGPGPAQPAPGQPAQPSAAPVQEAAQSVQSTQPDAVAGQSAQPSAAPAQPAAQPGQPPAQPAPGQPAPGQSTQPDAQDAAPAPVGPVQRRSALIRAPRRGQWRGRRYIGPVARPSPAPAADQPDQDSATEPVQEAAPAPANPAPGPARRRTAYVRPQEARPQAAAHRPRWAPRLAPIAEESAPAAPTAALAAPPAQPAAQPGQPAAQPAAQPGQPPAQPAPGQPAPGQPAAQPDAVAPWKPTPK
ncbi:Protein piccolo [Frankliniella fusca]|uniref:Protein piccolo n=1 Tax=Frankliniella fusca TaxID=407009 RepID=A0AAE1GXY0_9NEOP|nr:Protein piccolo [Frankliniella fusca]